MVMRAFSVLALLASTACAGMCRPGPPLPPPPVCAARHFGGELAFDQARMLDPVYLSGPAPQYTAEAICREMQGRAVIRCLIRETGKVADCCVEESLPYLDAAIVDALQKRRYTPATLDGRPIQVVYTFVITMKL